MIRLMEEKKIFGCFFFQAAAQHTVCNLHCVFHLQFQIFDFKIERLWSGINRFLTGWIRHLDTGKLQMNRRKLKEIEERENQTETGKTLSVNRPLVSHKL